MSGSRGPTPDTHASHDPVRIAALADRDPDLTASETASAQALLAACTDCARLYADLQTLAVALPATATPARPRDFTLSAADAGRLRPRGLRHWFGLIGSARDTVTRPLAVGLTTLGLAGLLVATIPGGLSMGSSAGASAPAEAPAAGAAASPESLQLSAAPAATVDDGGVFSGSDSGDPAPTTDRTTTQPAPAEVAAQDDQDATLLTIGGLLTLAGLGLFALRRSARSLARG